MKFLLNIFLFITFTCHAQVDSLKTKMEYWESGELKSISKYDKDYKQGIWQYFDKKGKITDEIKYVNGNLYFWNKWVDNIQVIKNGNGILTEFYDNGNIKSKGEVKDGKKWGEWIEYYSNGRIQNLLEFRDWAGIYKNNIEYKLFLKVSRDSLDKLIGENGNGWLFLTDTKGVITQKLHFYNNNKDSAFTYFQNGHIKTIMAISNYKQNKIAEYYENGKIKYLEKNNGGSIIRTEWYENNNVKKITQVNDSLIIEIGYYQTGIKEYEQTCIEKMKSDSDGIDWSYRDCNIIRWNMEGIKIENN